MTPVERLNRVGSSEGPVPWKGTVWVVLTYLLTRYLHLSGYEVLSLLAGLVALAGAVALLPSAVRSLRTVKAGE